MTLSARNKFFKGGIILAGLSLGLVAAGGYFAFPAYPAAAESASMRSEGAIQAFAAGFAKPSAYVPFWTMAAAAAYSLISIIFINYFFEKTQSPEIIFLGFFVISLSFELARMAIPLKIAFSLPSMYLIAACRVLLFGRYFGLFSLFAASLYAAGLDAQKQQSALFSMIMASLLIALNAPVDGLVWDSSLKTLNGYGPMLAMVELGVLAAGIITFFISAYTRGSKTYSSIGLGAFFVFAGRNLLVKSDTWITPIPGILLLGAGTWFICSRLHKEYLWL